MTVFMTKEFFDRANRRQVDGATTVIAPGARKNLSEVVLAVVKTVPEGGLKGVIGPRAGIAFQPRSLLALLTYCYAKGVYASQDIEDFMRRDGAFRHCCAGEFPDWRTLRRFRKENRAAIERCLSQVLGRALPGIREQASAPQASAATANVDDERSGLTRSRAARKAVPQALQELEAAGRIESATLMDLMADDCDQW